MGPILLRNHWEQPILEGRIWSLLEAESPNVRASTSREYSVTEKMELYGTTDIEGSIVDTAVKRTELTKFIKEHTGLDITVDAKDVPSWGYNEKYDVFLIGANPWGDDSPLFEGKFVSGTKAGDTYTLKFHPDTENFDDKQPDRVIIFEKSGDKLVIKSNKLEKK